VTGPLWRSLAPQTGDARTAPADENEGVDSQFEIWGIILPTFQTKLHVKITLHFANNYKWTNTNTANVSNRAISTLASPLLCYTAKPNTLRRHCLPVTSNTTAWTPKLISAQLKWNHFEKSYTAWASLVHTRLKTSRRKAVLCCSVVEIVKFMVASRYSCWRRSKPRSAR